MTHRSYEPAWLTEATFELEQLLSAIGSGDDEAWDRFQAKQDSETHDCDYYRVDGVCQYCTVAPKDDAA